MRLEKREFGEGKSFVLFICETPEESRIMDMLGNVEDYTPPGKLNLSDGYGEFYISMPAIRPYKAPEIVEKTDDEKREENQKNSSMIFLNGSKTSFRCSCGCNVFTRLPELRYKCNSCEQEYQGE